MHTLNTSPSPSSFFSHHSFYHFTTRFRNPLHRFTSLTLCSLNKRNYHKVLCKNREKTKEEGDSSFLEEEILEFMQNSNNPNVFPTREELVAAGRVDLVKAIEKERGWFAYGWDLNEFGSQESEDFGDGIGNEIDDNNPTWVSEYGSSLDNRDIEAGEYGTEGISNRLDKDRRDHRATKEAVDAIIGIGSRLFTLSPTSNHHSEIDAKIDPNETWKGNLSNVSGQSKIRDFSDEPITRETGLRSLDRNANYNDIKSCILHLESDLSSLLYSLRSTYNKVTRKMDQKSYSDELSKLSDVQDRLHEILAKLAVLEEKMELAIMEAQKIVEEKQKMINDAQRALQHLKETTVIWPNNASEVLLVGSFDGWSTERKMEKSFTGIFTLCLKLYPGKYAIKFIVDGKWKIDPCRPIVDNNGHVSNLLFVRD